MGLFHKSAPSALSALNPPSKPNNNTLFTNADEKPSRNSTSTSSTLTPSTLPSDLLHFPITKTLHINAIGTTCALSSSGSLQTTIHHDDGSVAYVSTREKRCKGNCTLTDADGREVVRTMYASGWGCGKDPVLHVLASEKELQNGFSKDTDADVIGESEGQEIKTSSRWISRALTFHIPSSSSSSASGATYTWSYKRAPGYGAAGKKGTALVLTSSEGTCIAALVRNKETRTEGSSRWSAGNGGMLVLAGDGGRDGGVSEEVVVASCLVMLKREVDRAKQAEIAAVT